MIRNTLLLDLDGTLVEPAEGILGCVRHTLRSMGRDTPDEEDLRWMIGPPIRATFASLGLDAEEAVRRYRACYAAGGLVRAHVYPGVADALAELRTQANLLVCTSKATVFAQRVVAHFGLAEHFDQIYGAELGGRFEDKAELIAHILGQRALDADRCVMIGDRRFDILGGRANGLATVGVLWGHGDEAELTAAGADALCVRPEDLPQVLANL